uniref:Uncharacterized protein n=1 Tax=Ananas comosus var. bracteatus TaxID=296719 RepID=A0A6V7NV87_ANACO|nr:unnamed protein product [Ananas comosus var. bracteatus]
MMCQEVHCCSWGDFKHIDSRYALKLCASGFPPKSAGGVLLLKSAVKFERYLMGKILSVGTNVGQVEAGKKITSLAVRSGNGLLLKGHLWGNSKHEQGQGSLETCCSGGIFPLISSFKNSWSCEN